MPNENKTNSETKIFIHEIYKNNGTQTPVYKKPSPMPNIEPAKTETNKTSKNK